MPSLFNHVLVEYQARGETRWVDATAKKQGGGSLNRLLRDYGVGLPVAPAASELVEAPVPALESNVYQIKESLLLDTAGAPSILGIVVMAQGSHAEDLRRELESDGAETVARRRLQTCVDRFIEVERAGPLEYRDDRTENEFFLAETFEIKNFLKPDTQSSWRKLEVAAEVVAGLLPLPASGSRHAPLALPHPCHVVHTLEIYCVALPPAIVQQRTIENPWLQFTRLRKTLAGYWTITTTLTTLTDAVPPEGIDEYREAVREIRSQSTWSLRVPAGQDRPHQRSDFGALPAAWEEPAAAPPHLAKTMPPQHSATPRPAGLPAPAQGSARPGAPAAPAAEGPAGQPAQIRYRRRKRHRRRHRTARRVLVWQVIVGSLLVLIVLLLTLVVVKKANSIIPIKAPEPPPPLQDR